MSAQHGPIKVGDMVVVVRPNGCICAKADAAVGAVFQVYDIGQKPWGYCSHCLRTFSTGPYPYAFGHSSGGAIGLHRLKRIPPPDELGLVDEHEQRELETKKPVTA